MTNGSEARSSRIRSAVERVKTWMNANGAEVLVRNLAPGTDAARLDAFERDLGFVVPADLRSLWSVHAGQHSEQDGFVGAMDLLGPEAALGEGENVAMFVDGLREEPSYWDEAG